MIQRGDRVVSPKHPEWGVGEVWKIEGGDKAHVLFERAGPKQFSILHAKLEKVLVEPRPHVEVASEAFAP